MPYSFNSAIFIDLCVKKRIYLMVGYNLRFSPSLVFFRNLLINKNIGDLYSVHADVGHYLPHWRADTDYRKSVSAKKEFGGGVLLELSHELDYLQWLFGKPLWVHAEISRRSNLKIDVEDSANLLIAFGEKQGRIPLVVTLNMDFIRHHPTRECVAIGERGSLRWNGITGKVDCFAQDSSHWDVLFEDTKDRDFTYKEEIKHFVSCIELGQPPVVNGQDGLNVLELIEAAKKSHMTQKRIYLN